MATAGIWGAYWAPLEFLYEQLPEGKVDESLAEFEAELASKRLAAKEAYMQAVNEAEVARRCFA